MSKFTKKIFIAAVILIAAGFIMIQGGRMFGGKEYFQSADLDHFDGDNENPSTKISKKEEIEDFERINVDFQDFDLKILPSEDQKFYLSYSYDSDENVLTHKIKSKTLYLKESSGKEAERNVIIHIDDLKHGLIPMFSGEIEHETNTAYLYVPKNIKLNTMHILMEDGDLIIKKVTASSVEITIDDGDVLLENAWIVNTNIQEKDGDIMLKLSEDQLKDLDMDLYSKDGDIIIHGIKGNYTMNEDEEEQRFTRKAEGSSKILKAETKDGDIVLKKVN